MSGQLIILTCNVQPSKNVQVLRNEAGMRLNDYADSIKKWIDVAQTTNGRILILENSGNMELLKERLKPFVNEHMYFFENSVDVTSDKEGISGGEFAMLREALPTILNIPGIEYCWKVTGRLFVENYKQLSKVRMNQVNVNRFYKPFHVLDSRFIGFPKEIFYEIFSQEPEFRTKKDNQQIKVNMANFSSLEEYLTISLTNLECVGLQVVSMPKIPIFSGSSASTNKKLDSKTLFMKLKFLNFMRPIAVKLMGGSTP